MSKNGQGRPHKPKAGYVVLLQDEGYSQIGTDCHGIADERTHCLLGGNPVTIFDTLEKAKRAVRQTRIDRPKSKMSILRAAFMADKD